MIYLCSSKLILLYNMKNIREVPSSKALLSPYSFLYSMGLLSSGYMERLFASGNFLRGVQHMAPIHLLHIDEWVRRRCEPRWGYVKYNYNLFFYNPSILVFNLRNVSMFIIELSSLYGSVIFINTWQYNLPMNYMMRWYARGSYQSSIGTVWQCGTLSNMHSRFILVRRCLALPYRCFNMFISHWRCTFGKILLLIRILRNYFYYYEFYGRVRKEVNKLRKIFKMFYYYRFIESWSHLDSIVLLEPIYKRSYRMIKEVNNAGIPAIGSCSSSNTALWYDYWLPIDYFNPSANIFVTSFISNACMVGYKLRGLSLFLKNSNYSKYC
jgi:hypothetical protein